jgi:Domain of unknown function (DUF4389)
VGAPRTGDRSYPVVVTFESGDRIARWRPLVQYPLVLPHVVVLILLRAVAMAAAIGSWFVIVATGRQPDGLVRIQHLYIRYLNRVLAYAAFLHDQYPPFSFDTAGPDPGDLHGVRTDVSSRLEDRNRATVAFRVVLALPQLILLAFLEWVAFAAVVLAAIAVLLTGRWPRRVGLLAEGLLRWNARVTGYVMLVTDEYPPFSLD